MTDGMIHLQCTKCGFEFDALPSEYAMGVVQCSRCKPSGLFAAIENWLDKWVF